MNETMEKAEQISKLYEEIKRMKTILTNLIADKQFIVPCYGSNYVVRDKSVLDVTINAYRELFEQKQDQLNELMNGDYNKVMFKLSSIINEK